MEVPGPHIRMNQISTITNEGSVRFMTYTGAMNDGLFVVFLSRLLRSDHQENSSSSRTTSRHMRTTG